MKATSLSAMLHIAKVLGISKDPIQSVIYRLQDLGIYLMQRELNMEGRCKSYEDTLLTMQNMDSGELWTLDYETMPF